MTDSSKAVRKINSFFDGKMMELSSRLKRDGKTFTMHKPDGAVSSYYEVRKTKKILPGSFVAMDGGGSDPAVRALEQLWKSGSSPELLGLVPGIKSLARSVASDGAERSADVSPYIYEMF